MKYCFCYTINKLVKRDSDSKRPQENLIIIDNDNDTEIVIKCGPWRDTLDEAQKDEKLFFQDKQAFLNMIQE